MISNNIIQRIKCIKCVGLYIDDKLNWQEHTNACKNKITGTVCIINKVNRYIPVADISVSLLDLWNNFVGIHIKTYIDFFIIGQTMYSSFHS